MRKRTNIFLFILGVFLAAPISARGESVKVGDGISGGYCVPFGCSPGTTYQQVIDASLFTNVFDIRGVDFFNTQDNCCGDPYIDPAHYELWLSTTSAGVNGLKPTEFAQNRGADATRVFSGHLGTDPNGEVPPGPNTTLSFSWGSAFHFDPRTGNLLLEVRKTGGSFFGDDGTYLDSAENMVGSSHVNDFGSAAYWNNRSMGLIVRFNGTFGDPVPGEVPEPAPEPATVLLIGGGMAALAIRRRRRR